MRTVTVCASLLCALLASTTASAGTSNVGSPLIDRTIYDGSAGIIYQYLGGTQPLAGPGSITEWSFFDNENSSTNSKVTPLLY